jgi:hypothetical protein
MGGDFLIVIKNESGGDLQATGEIFKISLGKYWNTLKIFRGKKRK